ncbi:MAG TPA: hypothetical protein VFA04_10790 [Bryobacteraceae bacterium]|nr:hypothetical protein [Bryobacteraceae bacterium]
MSTAAQILANRQNSQSSTGPRTEADKAVSSQNAVKHGATAATVVLAWENREEFDKLHREYYQRFTPVGMVELTLLEEIVSCQWRMRRMELLITHHLDRAACLHPSTNPMADLNDVMLSPEVAKLQRYENTFRRAFESAWKKLQALQKQRRAADKENEAKIPAMGQPVSPVVTREPGSTPCSAPPEPALPAVASFCGAAVVTS